MSLGLNDTSNGTIKKTTTWLGSIRSVTIADWKRVPAVTHSFFITSTHGVTIAEPLDGATARAGRRRLLYDIYLSDP